MQQIFTSNAFHQSTINCTKCGWEGLGANTKQEYLFLTDATEVYCPSCNHYFGFINLDDEDDTFPEME